MTAEADAAAEETRKRLADTAVLQAHGLTHLSFSTIELASNPVGLLLKLSAVARDTMGTPAMVGNWTEAGVAAGVAVHKGSPTGEPLPMEDAVDGAIDRLSFDTALEPEKTRKRALNNTPSRIRTGINCLRPFGPADMIDNWVPFTNDYQAQVPINLMTDWLPIPAIGYLDFLYRTPDIYYGPLPFNEAWQGQPLIVDTKAPNAFKVFQGDDDDLMAQNMLQSYMRQGAIYKAATGCNFATLILHPDQVTGSVARDDKTWTPRFEWIELTPEREAVAIAQVRSQVASMVKFLSISTDVEELATYVTPDRSYYKFQGPRAQAAIAELWG
tara:strand:+ start:1464 stop:2447 length:984 start_codon:yes stop_codon:yes gene_type:complete